MKMGSRFRSSLTLGSVSTCVTISSSLIIKNTMQNLAYCGSQLPQYAFFPVPCSQAVP